MSEQISPDLSGNQWLDRLLELETAKKDALLAFDPDRFEQSVREQARLVSAGAPPAAGIDRDRALALSEKIRLNSALVLNLASISPHLALARREYTAEGSLAGPRLDRVRVKA